MQHPFQSQARSQSPGDEGFLSQHDATLMVSISGEKPIPWRLSSAGSLRPNVTLFQSQARSQSPGDAVKFACGKMSNNRFNLRREANPLATAPGLRLSPPLFVFQSQARSQSPGDFSASLLEPGGSRVSISGEKPIPWRRPAQKPQRPQRNRFNLRREANPLATAQGLVIARADGVFQSQARSQSPGDVTVPNATAGIITVSISGEKPIPWRLHAMSSLCGVILMFQSQARSQSPGDSESDGAGANCCIVSISGEKPIPWRQHRQSRRDE